MFSSTSCPKQVSSAVGGFLSSWRRRLLRGLIAGLEVLISEGGTTTAAVRAADSGLEELGRIIRHPATRSRRIDHFGLVFVYPGQLVGRHNDDEEQTNKKAERASTSKD